MEALGGAVEENLSRYGDKARSLEAEEERRGREAEGFLRGAHDEAKKPTITEDEIRRQFAQRAGQAGRGLLDQMSSLREYMGASGVTGGGMPAGLAVQAELNRMSQLTRARGDLMAFKATQDAVDRQRAFDRAAQVAGAINRPVSMLGVDFENQALQTRLSELGINANFEGNLAMAKAQKKASKDSLFGSLISGGLGLLGGLF